MNSQDNGGGAVIPHGVPSYSDVMGRAPGENFPVASRVLPGKVRADLLALYGFARMVDQIGDDAPGDRLAALDWLEAELDRAYGGRATHPVMVALSPTLRARKLPREPFMRLIDANRTDQRVKEYATWEQLLEYCTLSANPVGELVLHVLDRATPQRIELSDKVCTALQLTEHWQDVAEDLRMGRIYLPARDAHACGVTRADLASDRAGANVRLLMAVEVGRTRALFDEGAQLIGTLWGRPRFAVAAFVAGGRAALDAIEHNGFDVISKSPRPGPVRRGRVLVHTFLEPWL